MESAYATYRERMGGVRLPPMDADYSSEIANYPTWVAEANGEILGGLIMSFGREDAKKRKLCGENVVLAFFYFTFLFICGTIAVDSARLHFFGSKRNWGKALFVIKLDVERWSGSCAAQGFLLLFTWTACT